jgi:pyruvate,water dikinase
MAEERMWTVDDGMSQRYPIYTRGNVGEVFPDPVAPLTWTLAGRPGAELGWRDAWVRTGAFDADEFGPEDEAVIVSVHGSYCYLNVSLARIFAVRAPGFTPELMDQALFGVMAGVPPYQPLPTDEDPAKEAAVGETLQWVFSVQEFPEIEAEAAMTRQVRDDRPDLAALTDDELLERGLGLLRRHFRGLFATHLHTTFLATVPLGIVQAVCNAIGQPGAAVVLTAGLGGVDSAAPSWAMWELGRKMRASDSLTAEFDAGVSGLDHRLRAKAADGDAASAEFLKGFDDFVHDFGSRGPNEWEMRSPTWETNPEMALAAIDRMRFADDAESPQRRWDQRVAEREAVTPQLVGALAADPATQGQFAAAVAACSKFLPARERTKTNVIRLLHESRMAMREWGRRMVAAGHLDEIEDFGLIRADELDAFIADPMSLRDAIRDRRAQMAMFAELEPPFILVGEEVHHSRWPRRGERPVEVATMGDVLTGLAGAPGTYTGRARVIHSPEDPGALEPGDVLVAPLTDPSWTPLFVPAGAVVVDVGAPASHAIIVSREIGLPCVVSVTDATRRIPDGATITVDGTAGTVTVVEVPAQ